MMEKVMRNLQEFRLTTGKVMYLQEAGWTTRTAMILQRSDLLKVKPMKKIPGSNSAP